MFSGDGPPPFEGFGSSSLAGVRGVEPYAAEFFLPSERRAARRRVRQLCTPTPGVYGMIDAAGRLIYVGQSKRLRDRLLSYLAPNAPVKAHRIIERTRRLVCEPTDHEFVSLVRELELIRRWQPPLNVKGQPGRLRWNYVSLEGEPAPCIRLVQQPLPGTAVFGPLPAGRRCREAVRALNDYFQFCECAKRRPVRWADQLPLFGDEIRPGCLRHALGNCLGPCVAGCSQREYSRQVQAARAFLANRDVSPLSRLETAMRSAADARRFEHAARLRDARQLLGDLHAQLGDLCRVRRQYSFVYSLPDGGGREHWYLIRHAQVAGATRAPRDRRSAHVCRRRIEAVYGEEAEAKEDLEMILLVATWFRRRPDQLARTIPIREAMRQARQGGD